VVLVKSTFHNLFAGYPVMRGQYYGLIAAYQDSL
jgi:hypothetical protein